MNKGNYYGYEPVQPKNGVAHILPVWTVEKLKKAESLKNKLQNTYNKVDIKHIDDSFIMITATL